MKKFYFLLLGLFLFSGVNAQNVSIPDANFKAKLLSANTFNTIAKNLAGNYFKIDANSDNQIQISEAQEVSYLEVTSYPYIVSMVGIKDFINLQTLRCYANNITSLDVSGLTNLRNLFCQQNEITSLNVNGLTNLENLSCNYNLLNFMDVSDLINLQTLDCNNNSFTSLDVSSLTNLKEFVCYSNQFTSLNLSSLTNLEMLSCGVNQLSSLDVSNLLNLKNLQCMNNQIATLDVSNLTNLTTLSCSANSINYINLNSVLEYLLCRSNLLTSLDVSKLTNLTQLVCSDNTLPTLDLSGMINLEWLECESNQRDLLDVSGMTKLTTLYCKNNLLTSLFIKNGIKETALDFSNNPNLKYICADDEQLVQVQNKITTYGYANCHVDSYCSFVPGGTYYTIEGNQKFDSNNNGCDATDIVFPNLKISITDGTVTGSTISNETGAYSIPVVAGTHTLTPTLENPTYFNVSPTTTTVTFPTQASPFTQDFCITANGVHPDLEVTLLPTNPARPGFDATYKIIYKNKGTFTQSGSVNLTFDDAVLDFISSSPSTTTQTTNNFSWDFTNLLPFETREITLTLKVNAPTDTPPVNNDDVLDYTATITSPATDDTPNDNTSVFHQTVVGSYDPNDKTCIEGTTISPIMVGEYVHYVIRFENTGTYPAENIVVKDMIDLAKFDINTLVPIKGSHEFVTNITAGNKVEFIFENINLPFDDANNDGFVAFKIKTKSSLVLGDTFTNSANIYFDYNFPIVTNTATTTVQTLGKSDFEFAKYFSLYPNPASTVLNLSVKSGIEVSSINVYNTLGQLVIAIPNAQSVSNIDVSRLTSGNYFIKMNTDKGTSNTKFIKN